MTDERRPTVLHYHRPGGPKEPAWYVVACHDWARRHRMLCTLLASALAAVPLLMAVLLVYLLISGGLK